MYTIFNKEIKNYWQALSWETKASWKIWNKVSRNAKQI